MITFSTFTAQRPLQIVPYVPKPTSPRLSTKKKVLPGDDNVKEDEWKLAHTAHGVEVINLTWPADNEVEYEISGSGRESNDLGTQLNLSQPIANPRIFGASHEASDTGDRTDGNDRSGIAEGDGVWALPHRERSADYEQNGYAEEILSGTLQGPRQDYAAKLYRPGK
ncbi:hypothetical protein BU23DRAFT_563559 [Bimuria novae-zelandiae CBS 107.79]|uniref:Uncharacterized protein n=1 Tax=Bimuria novae-zelandiae CBS 107.79 TaxID=1447943 RepID=A0A6A5VS02_9PLEO|nr:hypothetical protein BU23DRAFT_563559 [Bimuria novae-zelandiae CBS 107.79]